MANSDMNYNQKLYRLTKDREFTQYPFHKDDLGERMSCICEEDAEFATTRYLLNHNRKEAYEVTVSEGLSFLKPGDIAPELRNRSFGIYPPIIINRYVDGLALFEWNTVEDGRAWEDEDGYGMRPDNPKFLYGVVNQQLEVVGKFRYIDEENKVEVYRRNPRQFLIDFQTSVKPSE